jgi:hypothetical protein
LLLRVQSAKNKPNSHVFPRRSYLCNRIREAAAVFSVNAAFMAEERERQTRRPTRSGIKNQIRGIKRLLKNEKLGTEARAAQKAKLEKLEAKEHEHRSTELERKMTRRYQRVRFLPLHRTNHF